MNANRILFHIWEKRAVAFAGLCFGALWGYLYQFKHLPRDYLTTAKFEIPGTSTPEYKTLDEVIEYVDTQVIHPLQNSQIKKLSRGLSDSIPIERDLPDIANISIYRKNNALDFYIWSKSRPAAHIAEIVPHLVSRVLLRGFAKAKNGKHIEFLKSELSYLQSNSKIYQKILAQEKHIFVDHLTHSTKIQLKNIKLINGITKTIGRNEAAKLFKYNLREPKHNSTIVDNSIFQNNLALSNIALSLGAISNESYRTNTESVTEYSWKSRNQFLTIEQIESSLRETNSKIQNLLFSLERINQHEHEASKLLTNLRYLETKTSVISKKKWALVAMQSIVTAMFFLAIGLAKRVYKRKAEG